MPALGMAQETGVLLQWLKAPGEQVTKGEPLMEVETDKTTAEVEAPASGILAHVSAQPGDVIPVGQVIALILAPGESAPEMTAVTAQPVPAATSSNASATIVATPIARRVAAEHNIDLTQVKPGGGRVQKEDVLAYIAAQGQSASYSRVLASPKARRLAQEHGLELSNINGTGPEGAVITADVLAAKSAPQYAAASVQTPVSGDELSVSRIWQVMAERIAQAWTTIPHFYLLREVNATRLITWLDEARARSPEKITYTDLLVKVVAASLRQHPRLNASWLNNTIKANPDVNIGLAVAIDDGLVVPVIHQADTLGLTQIAARRIELVNRAQSGKLAPDDLSRGTFTISNLGMYGVDAFNAIVNPPQAAILAVSRIADRVVAVNGQPAVVPMLTLSLSCDHRVVDGARGAQFLQTLAQLLEDPLRLLD